MGFWIPCVLGNSQSVHDFDERHCPASSSARRLRWSEFRLLAKLIRQPGMEALVKKKAQKIEDILCVLATTRDICRRKACLNSKKGKKDRTHTLLLLSLNIRHYLAYGPEYQRKYSSYMLPKIWISSLLSTIYWAFINMKLKSRKLKSWNSTLGRYGSWDSRSPLLLSDPKIHQLPSKTALEEENFF